MMQQVIDCDTATEKFALRIQNIQEKGKSRVCKPTLSSRPSHAHQLPLWAETVRCLPNEWFRGALFNARNHKQPRIKLKNAEIASSGNGRIIIEDGWEMRQEDETVVMQLFHMAKEHSLGQVIEFTPYSFCKAIRWSNDSRSYQRLRDCLERMHKTSLKIIYERKKLRATVSFYMIPMLSCYDINTEQPLRLYQVRLPQELEDLFRYENYNTRLEWLQRLDLPVGIATWLHGYYNSHETPHPIKLGSFKEWAGITMQTKHLRRHITRALKELERVEFLSSSRIDGDLVHVVRTGSGKNLAC